MTELQDICSFSVLCTSDWSTRHQSPFMATVLGAANPALMLSTESVELVSVEKSKATATFAEGGAQAVVAGIEATLRAIEPTFQHLKAAAAKQ